MKHLTVVIPTRKRIKKLLNTLNTIPDEPYISIFVVCDGDMKSFWEVRKLELERVGIGIIKEHSGAVRCRNFALERIEDGALCATDDVEFNEGSIQAAFEKFNELYPDDDGVIGFTQEGTSDFHPAGVVLVGQEWLKRYPNKWMYCPEYFHFSCQEIKWLADKVGKFHLEDKARLFHWHPGYHKELADETHVEARKYKQRDMNLIKQRKEQGLIWGWDEENE